MVIQTSQSYNFNASAAECVLDAFLRLGLRPTEITQTHMQQARLSAGFILTEFSNQQPNLWAVGLQTIPVLQGQATYTISAQIIMVLDLYITTGNPPIDRYLYPISRTEYAAISNKTVQGPPTQFWFDRLVSPTITFYPTPDSDGPYLCNFYSVRQNQDVSLVNGNTIEVPFRFLDAFCAGLAWKLSEKYAPEREDKLFARYTRAWGIAATQDVESVPLMIIPGVAGYWR
jgi:hypothetical protein